MSIYIPSNESLNDRMRLIYWEEFQYVYHTVKEVAAQIRKDNRRKRREFVTGLAITPIKGILAPISRMFNHRYSDEALFVLLSDAVCKIDILIREIKEYRETKYLDVLEKIGSVLVSFMGKYQSIQLYLFDSSKYEQVNAKNPVSESFKQWLANFDFRGFNRRVERFRSQFTFPTFDQLGISGLVISSSSQWTRKY